MFLKFRFGRRPITRVGLMTVCLFGVVTGPLLAIAAEPDRSDTKSVVLPAKPLSSKTNGLTTSESASGWRVLFDGTDTDAFRNYQSDDLSDGWQIIDDALVRAEKGAGDIVTKEKFRWFELSLDYKISPGGNSGVMFHVAEASKRPWHTGPEVQILDNANGKDPQHAGWLYQLYKPITPRWTRETGTVDAARPAGQWNQLYIRIAPKKCQVCLNGVQYYNFSLGSDDWNKRVSASKFAKFENFGKTGEGHLCLQDHGDRVAFRQIKIREIDDDGNVPSPTTGELGLTSELAFPNLEFEGWETIDEFGKVNQLRLLELTYAPGQPDRLYTSAQTGQIWSFENRDDVTESTLVLDISDRVHHFGASGANEQGLLGLAMHPRFAENRTFFTYHADVETNDSLVMRWTMSQSDPMVADKDSGTVVIRMKQPFKNHNAGSIVFGPDGYLYVAAGDGGSRNDPEDNGQDLSTLLGSILRIDVDRGEDDAAYAVPDDNPFVEVENARPEIFAFGFRNPWRLGFDPKTNDLWAADVGQELWEEINLVRSGGNYGWSVREGAHPFGDTIDADAVSATVDARPIDPVWEYDHQQGQSITGGYVCRSDRLPELSGKYIYADYVSGVVWALGYDRDSGVVKSNERILPQSQAVLAFGQLPSGDVLYSISSNKGEGWRKFTK